MFTYIKASSLPNQDRVVDCAYAPCEVQVAIKKIVAFAYVSEGNLYVAGFCCQTCALHSMNVNYMWRA